MKNENDLFESQKQADLLLKFFETRYPRAKCELNFKTPFQLLAATILSAQCTDKQVNKITPKLFEKWGTPKKMNLALLNEIEATIRSCGFFRQKAKALKDSAQIIVESHQSQVPANINDLLSLPGVGRKTANVVLGNAFNIPGLTVDTHLGRVANRFGLSREKNPAKIEQDLMALIPKKKWTLFSHQAIAHGRALCKSRNPLCQQCPVIVICPQKGL